MLENGFVYITQERLSEIENELQQLKGPGRREIAAKIAEARAHGDLSENAEYDAAKAAQSLLELKIAKMGGMLMRVRIVDSSKFAAGEVHILSIVRIKNVLTQKESKYTMVSPEEADFASGKLAITSPIGKGLLGKKVGDFIEVIAPAGKQSYEILEIS